MIIASANQQKLLLEIGTLDQVISRAEATLATAENNEQAELLRSEVMETSERLLQAHATSENLQREIKKLATDVEMVEARIIQDEAKSKQVSNERELKAVEQEIASLKTRHANLEDAQLGLMEELEVASAQVQEVTKKRTALNLELDITMKKQDGEVLTIRAQITELMAKRQLAFTTLDPELQSIYNRKVVRGIPIAQTLGRDCSACRLSVNAVQFESMMAEPADHLPTCPNCDALIIR